MLHTFEAYTQFPPWPATGQLLFEAQGVGGGFLDGKFSAIPVIKFCQIPTKVLDF